MLFRITACLTALACPQLAAAQDSPHDQAMRLLKAGNQRFVRGEPIRNPIGEAVRRELAQRERPYAIVLTSSDSRIAPEHVFDAGLGELYVIRVAGNVCDTAALASLEFAAESLQVSTCVVLGDSTCEALTLARSSSPLSPAAERLHDRLAPAIDWATRQGLHGAALLEKACEENVYQTIQDATQRSPVLRRMVDAERLRLVPAKYSHDTGEVTWLAPRKFVEHRATDTARTRRPHRVRGLPPHVATRMLLAGHLRFLSRETPTGDVSKARRESLREGHRPFAVVITDADSRVPPELVFDAGLGDLYVVRVAGTFVDDEVVASIEQAIETTGASLVVVLGSDRSHAIEHALQGHGKNAHLSPSTRELLGWLEPSIARARHDHSSTPLAERVAEHNCRRTVRELRAHSAIVRRAEKAGLVMLLGGMYRVASGDVQWLEDEAHDTGHGVGHAHAAPGGETISLGHGAHGDHGHHDDHADGAHGHHGDAHHGDHTPHGGHGHHGDSHANREVGGGHHDSHTGDGYVAHGHHHDDHAEGAHGHHSDSHHGDAHHGNSHGATDHHDSHGHATHAGGGHGGHDSHGAHADGHHGDGAHDSHGAHADGHGGHGTHEPAPSNLSTYLAALAAAIGGVSALLFWKTDRDRKLAEAADPEEYPRGQPSA